MSKVVYFRPLDGIGEVPLDLHECPRRIVHFVEHDFGPEDDPPEPGHVLSITFYLTPDGRWVEHKVEVEYPPWETPRGLVDIFEEVSPAYIIQERSELRRKLPSGLAMLEPYQEAMRQDALRPDAPWLYGPRSLLEPAPVQARGDEATEAPARQPAEPGSAAAAPTESGRPAPRPAEPAAPHQEKQSNSSDVIHPLDATGPGAPTPPASIEVFYSYAHEDEGLVKELRKHLSILKRQGVIREWYDREITAGTDWKGQIDQHLNSSGVILLLVSADFLASDYCYDVEMTRALERHEQGEARVIPVLLRKVDGWQARPVRQASVPADRWETRDQLENP